MHLQRKRNYKPIYGSLEGEAMAVNTYLLNDIDAVRRAKTDNDVMAKLIQTNNNLIWTAIFKTTGVRAAVNSRAIDKEDLWQEACIAFVKAVRTYDETRGTALSTHAVCWITGSLRNYVRKHGLSVQVGRGRTDAISIVSHARAKNPAITTDEVMAQWPWLTRKHVETLIANKPLIPLVISMEQEVQIGKRGDTVPISAYLSDAESDNEALLSQLAIDKIVSELPPRQKRIVELTMQGLSQARVAKVIGKSQALVSRDIRFARAHAWKCLRSTHATEVRHADAV